MDVLNSSKNKSESLDNQSIAKRKSYDDSKEDSSTKKFKESLENYYDNHLKLFGLIKMYNKVRTEFMDDIINNIIEVNDRVLHNLTNILGKTISNDLKMINNRNKHKLVFILYLLINDKNFISQIDKINNEKEKLHDDELNKQSNTNDKNETEDINEKLNSLTIYNKIDWIIINKKRELIFNETGINLNHYVNEKNEKVTIANIKDTRTDAYYNSIYKKIDTTKFNKIMNKYFDILDKVNDKTNLYEVITMIKNKINIKKTELRKNFNKYIISTNFNKLENVKINYIRTILSNDYESFACYKLDWLFTKICNKTIFTTDNNKIDEFLNGKPKIDNLEINKQIK